ncbi:hypothetical protein LXL04_034276 [Taraxacum kok-saghyz]
MESDGKWTSWSKLKANWKKTLVKKLQKLKNKQSSFCRLQTFGLPLLLQIVADMVRRLQMFCLENNT